MKANEVLKHEHKFRAKYSLSSPPGRIPNPIGQKVSEEEPEQHEHQHHVEASLREELKSRAENCGSKLPQRSKQSAVSVKPGYTRGVVIHTEQKKLSLTGANANASKEKREIGRCYGSQTEPVKIEKSPATVPQPSTRTVYHELKGKTQSRETNSDALELSPRQQDSLQRKKQIEMMMLSEREKLKLTKELEDKERIKMIQQYLDDVHIKPDVDQADNEPRAPRAYKVTRHGRLYSLLPRSDDAPPKIITRPAPILHSSHQTPNHCTMGAASKIAFKKDGRSPITRNKVRFFNDWNKTMFINYVNSKGEPKQVEDEAEQDPGLQVCL